MKLFSTTIGLTVASLCLLAVPAAVHAGERPISGSGSGALDNAGRLVGGGDVSHLGTCHLTILLDLGSLGFGVLDPYVVWLAAANGDVLVAQVIAQDRDELGALTGMTIQFRGTTGRFDDASGTAHLELFYAGWDGFSELDFDFVIDGMIDY